MSLVLCLVGIPGFAVEWSAHDDQPIPEPAYDSGGECLWCDGAYNMTIYQVGRALEAAKEAGALTDPEAASCNSVDEVPDSTWFTNRQARQRLSAQQLRDGSDAGVSPHAAGVLTVWGGKSEGTTPGFILADDIGRHYVVKFDPPQIPEMATGSEMVSARILHALGWNVPAYHLLVFDPQSLEISPAATLKDGDHTRALTRADFEGLLQHAAKRPDGSIRAIASQLIPGVPKGSFRTKGVRPDDANDRFPHEDRRELRGLRVVASWINYTDARRGNLYDSFVQAAGDSPGYGHLVHYFLDFSSTLGSGNTEWKSTKLGNEYVFDPVVISKSILSLGLWAKPWDTIPPVAHPALGYFEGVAFDPQQWRTSYPQPLFDKVTVRDSFWGAKLIASITPADLEQLASVGDWSDPTVTTALVEALERRRAQIYAAYFDAKRIAPLDHFRVDAHQLCFDDLAVATGVVAKDHARYRYRRNDRIWEGKPGTCVPALPMDQEDKIEISASHDSGRNWSPSTFITLGGEEDQPQVVAIDRQTH